MKKLLTICSLSAILLLGAVQVQAAESPDVKPNKSFGHQQKVRESFEKRLNLTEKQKEKAKKIHQKGASQMKPIMKKIAELKKEIADIKASDIDENAKNEKIDAKYQEIKKLNKKANEIRKQNSKEFEKILTDEQKSELKKMKEEGRKKFEKNHPPRPPFNMFGQDFRGGEKGIFPPPPPPKFEK